MQSNFEMKLDFCICKTNVDVQKIDGSKQKTLKIVITSFHVNNKDRKSRFLKETFLFADIRMDFAFEMLFLTLSNVEINFNNRELKWKLYTIAKAFSTTNQIELVEKKEFVATILDS